MMSLEELEPVVMELKEKIDTILSTVDEAEKKYNPVSYTHLTLPTSDRQRFGRIY